MQENVSIRRVSPEIPLPQYYSKDAVGLDLTARASIAIPSHGIAKVPLGVIISPPQGYWMMLVPRSSLHKKGLIPANGVGIVDPDFCGPEDELQAILYNATDYLVTIEKAERIMQVVFLPFSQPAVVETTLQDNPHTTRGGLGSTGTRP